MLGSRVLIRAAPERSVDGIWWMAIGLFAGVNIGVAVMALLQVSHGRKELKPAPQWTVMAGVSPLEEQSTIF